MKLFNSRRKNGVVAVDVVHHRPGYDKNVIFVRTFRVYENPKLDLEGIFKKAFSTAHPDWPISSIQLRNES